MVLFPTSFIEFFRGFPGEAALPAPPSWGLIRGSVLSSSCSGGFLGKGLSVRWVFCALRMHLAIKVVYLRSLFLIIIVLIISFHADQQEPTGGGSKSFFNFHCDELLLHIKWCLICTRAPSLLNIELT